MKSFSRNTSNQEQAIKDFLRDYANMPKDGHTIHKTLSEACKYYDADRSYVFELNAERTRICNTYEWCRDGVASEIDNLQNVSAEKIAFSFEELEEKGELFVSTLTERFAPDSKFYRNLKPRGIESFAVVPLIINGSMAGFIGVDNPRCNVGCFFAAVSNSFGLQ